MKKILNIIFTALFLTSAVFAEAFDIINYDIKLDVDRYKNVKVTENIEADFHSQRHGLFRTIPLNSTIRRKDGTVEELKLKVKDISATKLHSKEKNGSNLTLKLGDADDLVSGRQNYKIQYTYQIPLDKLENQDEFYFNVIGTQWNNNIDKVNFKITMPKYFDENQVYFSMGKYGNIGYKSKDLTYKVNGRDITGETKRILYPNEALTLRLNLPNEYFSKDTMMYFEIAKVILISFFLTFVVWLIWFVYGKDDKVIPVVNFYPPKDLNSAEVGVLYDHDGKASIKNIVSLIVYLASKGYIKIDNKKKNFTLTKLKDYDGNNEIEEELMDILFNKVSRGETVTKYELETSYTFYQDCQKFVKKIEKIRSKIFEQDSIKPSIYILPVLMTFVLFVIFLYTLNSFSFDELWQVIPVLVFPVAGIFALTINIKQENKAFLFIWALCFICVPFADFIVPVLNITQDSIISLVPLIGIIISIICVKELPKRNKQGVRLLGNILGFRKFIETAEINKIKELSKTDSDYGFNIIPYAYILGVDSLWLKKIESVIKENPTWYCGSVSSFSDFTDSMHSVSVPSTANGGISSDSGSFSGGGGFSGGGCGGGGGGSW